MTGPIFYGEYELTIDDKNRMLVPSEVRKSLNPEHGEAFFMIIGTLNGVPWLYPEAYYKHLANQNQPSILVDRETAEFFRMTFALASRLEPDKQGRVLIPAQTIKRTPLKDQKEVTLIGSGDHLELWPRQAWEAEREAIMTRAAEIRLRVKEPKDSGQG